MSIVLSSIPIEDLKFVYSVPQIVDPETITCILEPTIEEGGLYVGGYDGARDLELLKKLRIRAVLTASNETAVQYSEMSVQFHQVIAAHDQHDQNLIQYADQVFDFIERHRKHTNVLIHCYLGISRSPTLITMYLMKKYGLNLEKALWKSKSKRRQVNPNVGFIKQLVEYEKSLGKKQQSQSFFKMVRSQAPIQQQQQQFQYQQMAYSSPYQMSQQKLQPQQLQPNSRVVYAPESSRVIYQKQPMQIQNFHEYKK